MPKYRTFFTIELLHQFFADGRCRGLRLEPTADCRSRLAGHRMTFRQVGNTGYALGWADDDSVPFIEPDPATVLRFELLVEDGRLNQFTALTNDPLPDERLYASNLSAHEANGRLHLTRPVAAHAPGADYQVGARAVSGDDLYECIKGVPAGALDPGADDEHWALRGPVRAPGPDDLIPFGNSDGVFELSAPVTSAGVEVFALNPLTNAHDQLVASDTLTFPEPTTQVPVPLRTLAAGRYRVVVEGEERFFYQDPGSRPDRVFGVVEIFNHLRPADPHALLDTLGRLKAPRFTLQFLNLLVVWKYIARTSNVQDIRDDTGVHVFDDSVALEFRSTKPIPVTEETYDHIVMDYKPPTSALTTFARIANPSPAHVKQIVVDGERLPCAEIHLNF